jgi:hypothetical protein
MAENARSIAGNPRYFGHFSGESLETGTGLRSEVNSNCRITDL